MIKKIALIGNQNCGKTTLFNALTGSSQHVGNFPGVTVEQKTGFIKKHKDELELIDLPGIYSLSPYTSEEIVSIRYLLEEKPCLIINIIEKTGYKLDRIEINDVEKDTYYATLFLKNDKDEFLEIDSRPSDAIALAIRVDAPIFVTANVISNGSVSTDSAKDEEEAQEFKKFVQSIKPSDFAKLMKDNDHHESDQ